MKLLPRCLQESISVDIYHDWFLSMRSLRNVSEGFKRSLALTVESRVLIPQEYVAQKGDIALAIYYFCSGGLDLLDETERTVLNKVKEKQHYGEIECILKGTHHETARANEYSEVLVLKRTHIHAILDQFPQDAEIVLAAAKKQTNYGMH